MDLSAKEIGYVTVAIEMVVVLWMYATFISRRTPPPGSINFGIFPRGLRLRSLSLYDLYVLSQSKDERSGVIKEFYDWQHKLLLAVITGLIGFIAANIVLVLQASIGNAEALKGLSAILSGPMVAIAFAFMLTYLTLLVLTLITRLGQIPEEYRVSINLYERMR
jgi:hypothetical protein